MIQKRGHRWRVVVQAPRDPLTRRRHQLSGSAATERDAAALERQLRLQIERGVSGRLTLGDLVDEWWGRESRLAPTTRANYRQNLDRHVLPILGDHRVEELRPRLLGAFFDRLRQQGLSGGTVRKVRTVLSAVMSYAVAMEYAESNPVMKVPPPPTESAARVAPTLEETARILVAAERFDPDFLTFLWVAAEAGGRRGEILALRWGDLDTHRATLTIHAVISAGLDGVQVREGTKTGAARTIAVSPITLARLAEHRTWMELNLATAGTSIALSAEDYIFSGGVGSRRTPVDGKPWRPDSASRRFRNLKAIAEVRPETDLHGLRHTMITELLVAGVDPRTVMGRAGHSSPTVTMSVYAKVRPAADQQAAQVWAERLAAAVEDARGAIADESPEIGVLAAGELSPKRA
jgi:integrase